MMKLRFFALTLALIGCYSAATTANIFAQESADALYQEGADYLKAGKLDEAVAVLSKSIELNPQSDQAYYSRAMAYEAQGELDRAIADYTKSIDIHSPNTIQSAYNNRGLIYRKKGELDKALADYTRGIEEFPDPSSLSFRYFKENLHRNRLQIYILQNEYDKALADARSMEALGATVDQEFIKRLQDHDTSLVSDLQAAQAKPEKYPGATSDFKFYHNRGYASYTKGDYSSAILDYNKAIEIDPDSALAYANRANAYSAQDKLQDAILDFNKALERDPKNYNVCRDIGLTYNNMKEYDKALSYFNKSLEINPSLENDGQFHNDRGISYFFLRDYDKCWLDVNKALQLGYPVHPQFLKELKKASARQS